LKDYHLPKLFLLITTYNDSIMTIRTTMEILDQAKQLELSLEIFIVDSSPTSSNGNLILEKFSDYEKFTYINVPKNYFWTKSVNIGFDKIREIGSPYDVLLVMNNDVEVSKNYVRIGIEIMRNNLNKCFVSGFTYEQFLGRDIKEMGLNLDIQKFKISPNLIARSLENQIDLSVCDLIGFRAIFIPLSFLFSRSSHINDYLLPHYWADLLLSYRARKVGFPLLVSRNMSIRHLKEPGIKNRELGIFRELYHPKSYRRLISFIYFWSQILRYRKIN
jgi:GT2 family glycosyltransferase